MERKEGLFDPLLKSTEQYTKTSLELLRLKSVEKTADVTSSLLSRVMLIMILMLCTMMLNIAVALWLGAILGQIYYGFLIVASFYAVVALLIWLLHPSIKKSFGNSIITQILN